MTDEVASCPIINQSLECRDLVDEAKDYHLMPERRKFLKSFRFLSFDYIAFLNKNFSPFFLQDCPCIFLYSLNYFRIKQRCCQDAVGVIYAVGGLTSTGDSLSTVEMYNPAVGNIFVI